VGEATQIVIRQDGSGIGSDWLLDRVEVCDEATGEYWNFPCNAWLDKGKGLTKTLKAIKM